MRSTGGGCKTSAERGRVSGELTNARPGTTGDLSLARSDHHETLTARGEDDYLATESIAWTLPRGNWASSLSELGSCFQEDGPRRGPFDRGRARPLIPCQRLF